MKHMNNYKKQLVVLLVGLLFGACEACGFVSEMWPDEGRPVFRSKKSIVLLYEQPSAASSSKEHKIGKGIIIKYDETRYRNVNSGTIKIGKDVSLEGRDLGELDYLSRSQYYEDVPVKSIQFEKGGSIEYLQYRAEGGCIIRWNKKIIELIYCPWFDDSNKDFEVINKPVNDWWVRVVKDKKPIGWLLIDEKTVSIKREF